MSLGGNILEWVGNVEKLLDGHKNIQSSDFYMQKTLQWSILLV